MKSFTHWWTRPCKNVTPKWYDLKFFFLIFFLVYVFLKLLLHFWNFVQQETLSQARESLKDYQWAAQGAIVFLHNAEATFLSAPGRFLDCTEEQRQTQQALEALEDGFQAHICHLEELVPQEPCLSKPEVQQLHISLVSQLLVGRAVLEAQAQLRLESLQRYYCVSCSTKKRTASRFVTTIIQVFVYRCVTGQRSHRKWHENMRQQLSALEIRLAECIAAQVTSYEKCVAQQKEATVSEKVWFFIHVCSVFTNLNVQTSSSPPASDGGSLQPRR